MRLLKYALPMAVFGAVLMTGGTAGNSSAEAQSNLTMPDTMPARDAATPAEDIALTNSCIEAGQEKIYCVCKTKIFKNEMNLRDYRGAVALQEKGAEARLTKMGYDAREIIHITDLSDILVNDEKFRTRCHEAETFFAVATEK